jgi:poly(3-hydroxybutyrate) depolymerase
MNSAPIPEESGSATFSVNGKHYKTWYTVFGDLKSGQTPLITLHGGPGMSHH